VVYGRLTGPPRPGCPHGNAALRNLGSGVPIFVTESIPSTSIVPASSPVVLKASGVLPSLSFVTKGKYTVKQESASLNLLARDPEGVPIPLGNFSDLPDSDGDVTTVDVPLTLSPATQNTLLGSFQVVR
jgi:hypothetical protein